MTRDELWTIYTRKNPKFADATAQITITGASLRKFFDQAYDQGHEQGILNGRALEQRENPPLRSLAEEIFGRKL